MDEHKEELATLETLDSGAVYTLALKTHIGMSVDTFKYFAGWCDKIQVLDCLLYYGVMFFMVLTLFCPWNFLFKHRY